MNMLIAMVALHFATTSYALSEGSDSVNCPSIWNDEKHLANNNTTGAIRMTMLHQQHRCSAVRGRRHIDLPPSWHSSRALDSQPELEARLYSFRRRAPRQNISMPVNAAVGHGFVAQVALGTPPTTQTVLIDTAASFSWVQCSPCARSNNGCFDQDGPLLDSLTSSTYTAVPCLTPLCTSVGAAAIARTYCGTGGGGGDSTCLYRIQYMDRSVSEGSLSRETLTLGQDKFPGFVFGCSRRYGPPFGRYSGIFGFANDRLSFFSQVVDKSRQYRAFSYYLPSPTSVGFIQVGSYDDGGLAFTPMFTKGQDYLLRLTDITVDGYSLDLASSKFSGQTKTSQFLMYLDLGSTLSILPNHVYENLRDAVVKGIKGYERTQSTQRCCFDPSFLSMERRVPTVQIHFRDGVSLVLDGAKLMYETSEARLCLGFVPSNIFLLGSMQLQMIYAVQDVEKGIMGFPRTSYASKRTRAKSSSP